MRRAQGLSIAATLVVSMMAAAQTPAAPPSSASQEDSDQAAAERTSERSARPRPFVTQHRGQFNGVTVEYTATVAEVVLPDSKGQPVASLVSIAYTKNDVDVKDSSTRPVTFLFNGGPGASSSWLHIAAFGPRRAALPNDGKSTGSPPYATMDNAYSLLDVTDLVFIDPVGTGFSRLLSGGKPDEFFGTIEDGRSMCDFLRIWLTQNRRWNSPKFILGESYGTIRAAEMAKQLPGYGILVNGIILFGQATDFTHTTPIAGLDTSYPLYLPSMAATAWYYSKVPRNGRTLETAVEEARQFAQKEYAEALFPGSRLAPEERVRIANRLSDITGLPQQVILDNDIRVPARVFCTELLKNEGKIASRYDARYTIPAAHGPNEEALGDPIGVLISADIVTVLNQYLRTELAVDLADHYENSARLRWNWDEPPVGSRLGVYENVAPYIGAAMRQNPDLRLFVANGYYDMLTPLLSAEYAVAHAGIPMERVQFGYYHAGHMPYLGESNLKQLAGDLRTFIAKPR